MFYAYVFHQDPTSKNFTVRRTGSMKKDAQAAIRAVEKSKKEGYVVRQGARKPIWHNLHVASLPF